MLPPNGQYVLETTDLKGDAGYLFRAPSPGSWVNISATTTPSTQSYQAGVVRDTGVQ
jgi:hypothetical protein